MRTAIIYASKNGATERVALRLKDKIKGEVRIFPITKFGSSCLLKYDFVIIAGSIHFGRIQSEVKSFVNKNAKTLQGINYGLYIMCIDKEKEKEYLEKAFTKEIVDSAFIVSAFGGEIDPNEGNFLTKGMKKKILEDMEKEGKGSPSIKWELVDEYADEINSRFSK